LSNKEAHFNKISEEQRQKYLQNFAILPVELSSTIAKIRIALAALHGELREKEKVTLKSIGKIVVEIQTDCFFLAYIMHSVHRCTWKSLQFFIMIIMMASLMRVS